MLTLLTSILATALLAQPRDSIVLTGVVFDAAEKPLSDADVVLWTRIPGDGTAPTLARTTTDLQGAFRFQIARQPLPGMAPRRFIFAYQPGRSIAVQAVDLTGDEPRAPIRMALAVPSRRTLTILGPDDRPVAGVRVVPVLCAFDRTGLFRTPDDWLERLTISSDPNGVAVLPYFPSGIDPVTLRVRAPGIAPHDLPLVDRPAQDRITLKLGRPASLAGSVYNDSGQPARDIPIEVWVENTFRVPGEPDVQAKVSPSLIRFDSGPVRADADGSFQTPAQLLTGSSYRIIIRPEGGPLVTSDWLKATGDRTTFPAFRLKQHRKLLGFVQDRQGKPVAGARVFLPSGKPSTTTDAQGGYLLEGALPDKTFLLVKAEGFRFQGWPGIPAREPRAAKLILIRASEPTERTMVAQPAPISPGESRALARRLLEPSLQAVLGKGDDRARWELLRIASRMDPARVLELLEKHAIDDPGMESSIRKMVAATNLATDPVAAESLVRAMPNPKDREWAYVELAAALPDDQRALKRKFLEVAAAETHAPLLGARNPESRRAELGRLARAWLDLGEVEQARPLVREGLETLVVLPKIQQFDDRFLATAARIEPDRVLSLIGKLSSAAERQTYYARIAESLAIEHPAEAERVFQLTDPSPRTPIQVATRIALQLRLCRRLAKSDPPRAHRIIAGMQMPQDQALGWALLALGLADQDKKAANTALAESIEVIDRVLDSATNVKPAATGAPVEHNPAALILPIVEKVAPERLEEVFWRAVALMPNDDLAQKRGTVDHRLAEAAVVLGRYDRQVADLFVTRAMSTLPASRTVYTPMIIRAKAGVDPQGAVTLMQALPPGGRDGRMSPNSMMYSARDELLIYLIEQADRHWQYVWTHAGVDFDERSFP
jgi:hypothetical protein